MIEYSSRAVRAIGFLKRPKNDVEIYVEDSSKVKQWLALIKNCMPIGMKISSVTPLGSRDMVLAACKNDQQADGRKRLYIIDGDFDFIQGKRKLGLKFLYRLPAYCLEALFFRKSTIKNLIATFRPDLPSSSIAKQYNTHIEDVWGVHLRRLFTYYGLHHSAGGGCVTSGYHVSRLRLNPVEPWHPNARCIADKCKEVGLEIKKHLPQMRNLFLQLKNRAMTLPIQMIISGKSYLLPIARNWLSGIDIKLSGDDLMLAIARENYPLDKRLKNRLQKI